MRACTTKALVGEVSDTAEEVREAERVARTPMLWGWQSAVRCADAAYWASWADALPMINERTNTAHLVVRPWMMTQQIPVVSFG